MGTFRGDFYALLLAVPFVVGVALSGILLKFITAEVVRGKWPVIVSTVLLISTIVFTGLWPVVAVVVLLRKREYILACLPALYSLPTYLCVLLLVRPIYRFVGIIRKHGHDAARQQFQTWSNEIARRAPNEDQIADHRGVIRRFASGIGNLLFALVAVPNAFFKAALGVRVGLTVAYWPDFPASLYAAFILLSYLAARDGHPVVALLVSAYILAVNLFEVGSKFETKSGVLLMFSQKKYQVGLSAMVVAALLIVGAFGCGHYAISKIEATAYSRPLTAIDSLYFSVTTFATVGYGDIYPRSDIAKLACMAEIATGCFVLVFGVGLAMTVWTQRVSGSQVGRQPLAPESTPAQSTMPGAARAAENAEPVDKSS